MTFNFFPGNVSEETAHVATINGVIDRGNRTWTFEDEFGFMFRASLLNGNMVNGTVYQPATDDTFTFIGIATDWNLFYFRDNDLIAIYVIQTKIEWVNNLQELDWYYSCLGLQVLTISLSHLS